MKTTQERINEIIATRYRNYKPSYFKPVEKQHNKMRTMTIPLKWWQVLINAILPVRVFESKKLVNDEKFLDFLEKLEREHPQIHSFK